MDEQEDMMVSLSEGELDDMEVDLDDMPGGQPNGRLFLAAVEWARGAVRREIDYRLLVPRFAPSERAWLLGREGDDR